MRRWGTVIHPIARRGAVTKAAESGRLLLSVLAMTVIGLPVTGGVTITGATGVPVYTALVQEALPVQTPIFRAAVTRVRVDTIVTDKDGNFVDGLTAADFRVFEDGVEQDILNVQLVSLTDRTVRDMGSRASKQPVPEDTDTGSIAEQPAVREEPTAVDAPPARRTTASLGAIVYLVDLPSMDRTYKPRLTKTFEAFLDGEGALDVPCSIYMIDQTGTVQELAPLTTDREVLRAAAAAVAEAALTRTSIFSRIEREYAPFMEQAINAFNRPFGGQELELIIDRLEQKIESDSDLERVRTEQTLQTVLAFINALSAMEGRTALVWISSGAMITEGGPYAAFGTAVREAVNWEVNLSNVAQRAPSTRIRNLMEQLYETANTANVSIYTIDPLPISGLSHLGTSAAIGSYQVSTAFRRHVRPAFRDLSSPLVDVAIHTGGRAFIGWGDLDRAFQEQYTDATKFYLVSYEPPPPQEDGAYHETTVEVNYPDAEVRARPGYRELPETELTTRKVAAALALPGSVMGRPVPTAAFHRFADDGSSKILLVAGLPRPAETVTGSWAPAFGGVDPNSEIQEEMIDRLRIPFFRVHAIALNRAGEVLGETHELVEPREDIAEYAPDTPIPHFRYTTEWAVEPGEYDIRVLVAEEGGDRIGTSRLEVRVPPNANRWAIADPMLAIVDTADGLRPLLQHAVPAGVPIGVSVQLVGATSPHVSALIFHRATRRIIVEVAQQPLLLGSPMVHGGVLPLPHLNSGKYLVEVQIVDSTVDRQAVRLLPLQVVAGN